MLNNSHLQTWSQHLAESPQTEPFPPFNPPPAAQRHFLHYYFDRRCRSHATVDCPLCIADHGPQQASNTFQHQTSPTNLNPPPESAYAAYQPSTTPSLWRKPSPPQSMTAANQWREKHPVSNVPQVEEEDNVAAAVPENKVEEKEKRDEGTQTVVADAPKVDEKSESVTTSSAPKTGEGTPEPVSIPSAPKKGEDTPETVSTPSAPKEEQKIPEPIVFAAPPKKEECIPEPEKQERVSRLQRLRVRAADLVRGKKSS